MGKKDGDSPKQGLLDESTRIPPSPKLIRQTLREIGAPEPERTAKLLASNGISFLPVEMPARRSRTSKKAQAANPVVVSQQPPSPPPSQTSRPLAGQLWSVANLKRYGRDCSYALAVRWGSGLLGSIILAVASCDYLPRPARERAGHSIIFPTGAPTVATITKALRPSTAGRRYPVGA